MAGSGVDFRLQNDSRSSTPAGKAILAASVRSLDPALADRILGDPDWRRNYPGHLTDLARVEAATPEAALTVARAGMGEAWAQFAFVTEHGDRPLSEGAFAGPELHTREVVGTGKPETQLRVPYHGQELHGDALLRQLDDWVARGITEPSFAEAVGAVVRNPDWLDLSDRTFALIGAGSQMGPLLPLLSYGARVAGVDIPRPQTWERLTTTAEQSAGRLLVPLRPEGGDAAGADLLTEPGSVLRWLAEVPGPVTIGNYGYLDGAGFVRISMAFDLVFTELARRRTDLSFSYLATPSDVFLVPIAAVQMAQARLARLHPATLAARAAATVSGGRVFAANYTDNVISTATGSYGLVNAFIVDQGQNYALAKRIQRWRTLIAHDEGMLTSVHVAPPTRTRSVHSNPVMEERQRLTGLIGIETFDADTAQALGSAILVHDLRNPAAPANPDVKLPHPHELFMFAANPGGRWRGPLDPGAAVPSLAAAARAWEQVSAPVQKVVARIRH